MSVIPRIRFKHDFREYDERSGPEELLHEFEQVLQPPVFGRLNGLSSVGNQRQHRRILQHRFNNSPSKLNNAIHVNTYEEFFCKNITTHLNFFNLINVVNLNILLNL